MMWRILLLIAITGLVVHRLYAWQHRGFDAVVSALLSHSVHEVHAAELDPEGVILLDAREASEYAVSRIAQARHVGYDQFDLSSVADLDKETPIVVYCSIGYRSEKIAERLEKAGFTQVSNLYGGIFDWSNQGNAVMDSLGRPTPRVHGYNRLWGKWLRQAEVVY